MRLEEWCELQLCFKCLTHDSHFEEKAGTGVRSINMLRRSFIEKRRPPQASLPCDFLDKALNVIQMCAITLRTNVLIL
jgi:hypothetical protein